MTEVIPLVIDGPVRLGRPLPAYPLPGRARDGRALFVTSRPVRFLTPYGWQEVPAGYVTDFASIPRVAAWRIHPLDRHAWAALLHDWRYAVGEPGKREMADAMFLNRLEMDGVWEPRRTVMYRAVQLGGEGGFKKAPTWWDTENFADPETGCGVRPPFFRTEAFDGQRYGLKAA